VAREAGTTFALGVGVTIAGTAAVGAGIVSAPFALAVGGIALTASAGASYLNRWEEASSNGIFHEHGRIGLAAIGDAVGLSGLYEGTVGRSIITDCSLTEEEQSRRLGRGLGSVAAIGTAGRAGQFGTNLGSQFNSHSGFGEGLQTPRELPPPFSTSEPLGLGSTGRTEPISLNEQLAMGQAMSNPSAGRTLPTPMTDPRWLASEGWVKRSQNINGTEIHYVENTRTGQVDDFKFK
jgi:hypothetical protein